MAETDNIAEIAEILANDLFARFLWFETGGWNQNWKCVRDDHVVEKRVTKAKKSLGDGAIGVKRDAGSGGDKEETTAKKILTHPSDVVFYYDEPYALSRTYINTDLKSYKKGSITTHAVTAALKNLALSLECAEVCEEWQEKYVHDQKSYRIVGLLFIYNHDGDYDAGFDEILAKVNQEKLRIPRHSRIFVLGPRDIRWLDNVRLDLVMLHGKHKIPHEDKWTFFYPDLVRKKKIQVSARAATLEMLTGPWIIMSYAAEGQTPAGYIVYLRGRGKHTEEFLYLLDHLMHYQMVKKGITITIRVLDVEQNAPAQFQRARDEYIENYDGADSEFAALLKSIGFEVIEQVKSQFSQVQIGMRRG